jgi:putative FmdB family regulatory protein
VKAARRAAPLPLYNFAFQIKGLAMPIYAYRCASCGHSRDVLQKLSDPVLSTCPACGADQFQKQLTAAGFQLKGSGWYVTDFRGGSNTGAAAGNGGDAKPAASEPAKTDAPAASTATSSAASSSSDSGGTSASGGCGTSCAH